MGEKKILGIYSAYIISTILTYWEEEVLFDCNINTIIDLQEIRQLCSNLLDLKKASAEEMRRSVYANYTAFIR